MKVVVLGFDSGLYPGRLELQGMAGRLSVEAGNAVRAAGPLPGRTSPCGEATEALVMLTSVGSWGHRKDYWKLGYSILCGLSVPTPRPSVV